MNQIEKKLPPHQKVAFNYFKKLSANKNEPEDEFHIINKKERAAIDKAKRTAIISAALMGAIAVLAYYLPIYIFPEFFQSFNVVFNAFGIEFPVNFVTISISLFWIFVEIFFLTRINIKAVAETANACGFPDKRDPNHDLHLEQLFSVGLETKNKETLKFGIDPFAGVPRFYIFIFTALNLLKATLTNFFVKMIAIKIFARCGVREFADLVGIPVFAVWNAYAANKIIESAKIYIMAPGVINRLANELEYLKEDQGFKQNIFDAMQYVVSLKRSFHHNHYLLVEKLISVFDLTNFKDAEPDPIAFLEKIKNSEEKIKKAYSKLIVMGMLIDGGISYRDKKALETVFNAGIININPSSVKTWCKQFRNGEGLEDFIKC